jgi:hypothetical protein
LFLENNPDSIIKFSLSTSRFFLTLVHRRFRIATD